MINNKLGGHSSNVNFGAGTKVVGEALANAPQNLRKAWNIAGQRIGCMNPEIKSVLELRQAGDVFIASVPGTRVETRISQHEAECAVAQSIQTNLVEGTYDKALQENGEWAKTQAVKK